MKRALFALAFAAVAIDAAAQTPQNYQDMWNARIDAIKKLRDDAPLDLVGKIGKEVSPNGSNITAFFLFAHAQNQTRELRLIEDARTDKQLGSPAATSGSTSLVARAAVPSIFGFAVEHGALTQTSNATSATVRGNAVGWLDLLQDQDVIAWYDDDSPFVRALRRLSYSFTFNTDADAAPADAARPSPAALEAQIEAAGRQLGSYSVRVTILDQRDPRRRDNRASVARFVGGAGVDLLRASAFLDPTLTSPAYDRWLADTQVVLSAPGAMARSDIERVLYRRLEILRSLMETQIAGFEEGVAKFVNTLAAFESGRTGLFERMQKRFVMGAELVRIRPPLIPASSTFRVVAEGRPGGAWNIAGNVALTYQDSGTVLVPEPTETRGWRDFQVAVQAERTLGRSDPCAGAGGVGRPALAFEYLLQDLRDKAVVTFGGHQFAVEKGLMHAALAKLTIPVKGSGVKIPLSISYANRTELLREKNVRGHIGMTFDLDVLAAAVRQ